MKSGGNLAFRRIWFCRAARLVTYCAILFTEIRGSLRCLVIDNSRERNMDEFFASKPATNESFLCVGPLTRADAIEAAETGIGGGLGYYIYVASASDIRGPVEILGKL